MSEMIVNVAKQQLSLQTATHVYFFQVSTSRHGTGQVNGSYQTPLGEHKIRAKIGAGAEPGTIFRGRRPTGQICDDALLAQYPDKDWITTRILWLVGLEPGFNRFGAVDSMARYIYIHGTPHADQIGTPGSIGCIRMRDADVIKLFDLVAVGDKVTIYES